MMVARPISGLVLFAVGLLTWQDVVEATGDHLHYQVGGLQRLKLMQGTVEQREQRSIPEGPAVQLVIRAWDTASGFSIH